MSMYEKAKDVEIKVDKKNTFNALVRNTVTGKRRTFSIKTEVDIVDLFSNGIPQSIEDIKGAVKIPEKSILEVIKPLLEEGFLIEYDLPD